MNLKHSVFFRRFLSVLVRYWTNCNFEIMLPYDEQKASQLTASLEFTAEACIAALMAMQ